MCLSETSRCKEAMKRNTLVKKIIGAVGLGGTRREVLKKAEYPLLIRQVRTESEALCVNPTEAPAARKAAR